MIIASALLGAGALVGFAWRALWVANWLVAKGYSTASRLCLRWVAPSVFKELTLLTCDLIEGQTDAGLARVEGLLACLPQSSDTWRLLLSNTLCNVLINAGRYREALALRRGLRTTMRACPSSEPSGLIVVNAVEALYNLGRWRAAERICTSALEQNGYSGLALEGMRVQLAWIYARTARPDDAEALLAVTSGSRFPVLYRSEVHFTLAAVALSRGECGAALRCVEQGARLAKRASSKRNAEFLRAEILFARGDLQAAEDAFRRGAQSVYRAQGGASLALWADCLVALGRPDEASRVAKLVVERDPQSEAAAKRAKHTSRTRAFDAVVEPGPPPVLQDALVGDM